MKFEILLTFPKFLRSSVLSGSVSLEGTRIYHIYCWQSVLVLLVVRRKFGKVSKNLKIL